MQRGALLATVLAFGACSREVQYQVKIVTQACHADVDPFTGVRFLKVMVRGDGLNPPLQVTSAANPAVKEIRIPGISSGRNRVIDVRAYDGDPEAGGRLVSMGRSVPFTVSDVLPDDVSKPIEVNIFLRKVNAFTRVASASSPSQCQQMKVARAAHTATELLNGKVFITGGYNFKAGTNERTAASASELYNPATGAFESAKDLALAAGSSTTLLPRAHHSAIRVSGSQVLLWGGETYAQPGNLATPTNTILLYDADQNEFGAFPSRSSPLAIARSRHRAAMDKNGKVLIAGGVTRKDALLVPVEEVEWFDPTASSDQYKVVPGVRLPRMDLAVSSVKRGEFIAVAGGSDGTAVRSDVVFFKFNGTTFVQQAMAGPPTLFSPGRRSAAAASFRDGDEMLLVGGYSDPSLLNPLRSSEIVTTTQVAQGPEVGSRGDVCAVTLNDGSVLAVGGRTSLVPGPMGPSDASALLIRPGTTIGASGTALPNLTIGRYAHTCTALADGTALITGGIAEDNAGGQQILQDAYIFQPAPVD